MKKILYCIFIVYIIGCKKENNATQNNSNSSNIDPVGKWTFESDVTTQNGNTFTINTALYPCTAKNILLINSDGTATASYTGNDTCYIINTPTQIETFGQKGDSRNATWTKSGNMIYFNFSGTPNKSELSIVNSKYQMVFRDTIASINWISTSTFVK